MFRLIGVLVVLAALVVGIGMYRGWFHVGTADQAVTVTVDKDKMKDDEQAAKDKAKAVETKVKDKVQEVGK